ncbi:hypothetical protein [Pseudomonas moraviensis]|uniref:Uncharacterized protein n=1 Tax=Pseudomonas moraviensis R28-S TaxID=1395516 RepID=V8R5E3_9PSED|nr:hypothetical protein [Pseudomonas moraviensis]ETF06878.1 hypothetical protein PMO01_20345 [Pseudomonas moraviensis R28-S]
MNTLQKRSDALMGSACPKKASDADEAIHGGFFVWISVVREEAKS